MADPSRSTGTGDQAAAGPARGATPATPRWVKVFGIILAVLVVVFLVVLFTGGGGHGPGRHTSRHTGGQAPPEGHYR